MTYWAVLRSIATENAVAGSLLIAQPLVIGGSARSCLGGDRVELQVFLDDVDLERRIADSR